MKSIVAVPATLSLVYRARSRNSLTPLGIVVAVATAVAHAAHPWSIFFILLVVFFLAGSAVTKIKHNEKARLTHSSSGAPGGEGPRTHIQVLANSVVASVLILMHTWVLSNSSIDKLEGYCWRRGALFRNGDVLVAGIVAHYAAVAADTFSSELGILSSSSPCLITAPWRTVPPGTNGGVTVTGLLAGLLGSFIISATSATFMPFCNPAKQTLGSASTGHDPAWPVQSKVLFMISMTAIGLCGSLLDSLLGALFQASVVDVRTGKIVEGDGGKKVPVRSAGSLHMKQRAKIRSKIVGYEEGSEGVAKSTGMGASQQGGDAAKLLLRKAEAAGSESMDDGQKQESRRVETGLNLLSNNGVNLLMAGLMSAFGIVGACLVWDVPFTDILSAQ